jgi:hypothetical protein
MARVRLVQLDGFECGVFRLRFGQKIHHQALLATAAR